MAAFAAYPAIENDARNLTALAGACTIAKKIALAIDLALRRCLERAAFILRLLPPGKIARMGA
jgi:hypothetical protein